MTDQIQRARSFFKEWGSVVNITVVAVVGAIVLWGDARWTPRAEMEMQIDGIHASIRALTTDLKDQRHNDIEMVERQIRDMQRGMAARQQEHVDLHRLVVRLETIVDRMESPPDRR